MAKATKTRKLTALEALLGSARERSKVVERKVKAAMKAMEADIERSEGLYPFNAGRLGQSEVCRRAGISKQTLQNASHKDTTRVLIDEWLVGVQKRVLTGAHVVRKAVTDRAEDWKRLHSEIAHAYLTDSMDLINAQRRIRELEVLVKDLQDKLNAAGGKRVAVLTSAVKQDKC